MAKFFFMPIEVWYYVVIPIIIILLIYSLFSIIYRNKKGSYYYEYIVDYVYSSLGIIFCSLLLCLLLGYSIATIETIIKIGLLKNYIFLTIVLAILPLVPFGFLIYVISIYLNNLKRKNILDQTAYQNENMNVDAGIKEVEAVPLNQNYNYNLDESEFELKKKK